MNTDIYVEKEPHQGNEYFSRIMRFRNNRVAKFFADVHGGIYKGWVKGNTTFNITRGAGTISAKEEGCYIVVWEH
tara:strand:+ start:96 stop:320 length:225 start_codon:yes stop_codon:yes gene_type:complete